MGEYVVVAINNGAAEVEAECKLPAGYPMQTLQCHFESASTLEGESLKIKLAPYSFEVMTVAE